MDSSKKCGVHIESGLELYSVDNKKVTCWGDNAIAILDSLEKKMMTQRDLSRELEIPISTINKHIRILEEGNLISVAENKKDRDKRKKYYTLSAKKIMSLGPGNPNKDEQILETLLAMKGRPDSILTNMLSWLLLKGEALGIDFSHLMDKLGRDLYTVYSEELIGETGEETISNLSQMIVDTGILNGLVVLTYLPITFHGWYVLPWKNYPAHITKAIVISLVKSTIEGFYKRKMNVANVEFWGDEYSSHVIVVLE